MEKSLLPKDLFSWQFNPREDIPWTWLPQNFDWMTLRKKERGREPSCPPMFLVSLE